MMGCCRREYRSGRGGGRGRDNSRALGRAHPPCGHRSDRRVGAHGWLCVVDLHIRRLIDSSHDPALFGHDLDARRSRVRSVVSDWTDRARGRHPSGRLPDRLRRQASATLVSMTCRIRRGRRASPAILVVVTIAGFVAWSQQTHAGAPWQLSPDRIILCGRTYQRFADDPPLSGAEMAELELSRPLEQVGRIPPLVGRPVLAVRTERRPGWELCAAGVWLKVDADRFQRYGLVGGF